MATAIRRALALAALTIAAHPAQVQLPSSNAGRQLSAWLAIVNGSDRTAMQQFTETNYPGARPGFTAFVSDSTGGLDVEQVESADDSEVVILARERGPRKQLLRIGFKLTADTPARIAYIRLQPAAPSTSEPASRPAAPVPPTASAETAAPRETARAALPAEQLKAARAGVPFRQFSRWLDVFNSADSAGIAAFASTVFPSMNAGQHASFRAQTGGFELHTLQQATPTLLRGLMKERDSDQFAQFVIEVEPGEPHRILRLAISPVPRPADVPSLRMTEREAIAALRAKLERDTASGHFAGAVMLSRKGTTLFNGAYGLADREKKAPNKVDTRFRIGSMNKMFTATAVLQLAQAGKLKLTDPIGKYISDYPNQELAAKVTIHHLLTHTGGTGDIFGPDFDQHRHEIKTHDDYIRLFGKRPPSTTPGSRFVYSNYGMILAGVVIERVSGQSYYEYIDRHIFKPAGMTMTGSLPESEHVPGRATGYMRTRDGSGWTANTDILGYRGTAAGGGYSTVGDMVRFADALLGHKLLNAEYTDLLLEGKVDAGEGRRYAYGFEDDRTSVGHGGSAPGMNGELRIYRKSGFVVAVLSNLDPPAARRVSVFLDLRLPD